MDPGCPFLNLPYWYWLLPLVHQSVDFRNPSIETGDISSLFHNIILYLTLFCNAWEKWSHQIISSILIFQSLCRISGTTYKYRFTYIVNITCYAYLHHIDYSVYNKTVSFTTLSQHSAEFTCCLSAPACVNRLIPFSAQVLCDLSTLSRVFILFCIILFVPATSSPSPVICGNIGHNSVGLASIPCIRHTGGRCYNKDGNDMLIAYWTLLRCYLPLSIFSSL